MIYLCQSGLSRSDLPMAVWLFDTFLSEITCGTFCFCQRGSDRQEWFFCSVYRKSILAYSFSRMTACCVWALARSFYSFGLWCSIFGPGLVKETEV